MTFKDQHDITIRIPTTQKVSIGAFAPDLASVISALGLIPGTLRTQPREIVIVAFKNQSEKEKGTRTTASYQRFTQSVNLFQVNDEDRWEGNSTPIEVLFHEYAHLSFVQTLGMGEPNSALLNEYRNAGLADSAEISQHGQENWAEDFAGETGGETVGKPVGKPGSAGETGVSWQLAPVLV